MQTFRAWKFDAVQAIKCLAPQYGGHIFIASDLRAWAVEACLVRPPAHGQWWGQAVLEAQDLGYIRPVGVTNDKGRHGVVVKMWAAG